jgi:hypothetical protein
MLGEEVGSSYHEGNEQLSFVESSAIANSFEMSWIGNSRKYNSTKMLQGCGSAQAYITLMKLEALKVSSR